MSERPALDGNLDSAVFGSFYYLKEELVAFCKKVGLQIGGSKQELTDRIALFLDTGKIEPVKKRKKRVRALMIDTARRVVVASGNEVKLTRKEYEILLYMFTNLNIVLSYGQIYQAVWHEGFLGDCGAISFHICKLRKKLSGYIAIQFFHGVGYCLKLNEE